MTSKSLQDPVERLKKLGLSLRNRNGIDWATAKLELRREAVRMEFFRGKDFERYFVAHPELLEEYADKSGGKSVEERIADLGSRFVKSGLITKAQRKFKKPKPGKPRLVKWPRTLLPYTSTKDGWETDVFYVWSFERPTSAWTYILSFLVVFTIFAGCLLPIAPYMIKLAVFYTSLTLLFIITGFLLGRVVAWLLVWMMTGYDFWILPNVLSDEISLKDVLKPLISFEKAEGLRSHVLLRLLSGVAIGGLCWFLLGHNPGGEAVKERAKEMHDTLLDMMSIKDPSRQVDEIPQNKTEL